MATSEERAYTQSSIQINLEQPFCIAMREPSEEQLEQIRTQYEFSKIKCDDDNGLVGIQGRYNIDSHDFMIRQIHIDGARNIASCTCLGTHTDNALIVLEDIFMRAYGVDRGVLKDITLYITFDTVTKIQFSCGLKKIFSPGIQEILEKWENIKSQSVTAVLSDEWPPRCSAMVNAKKDYWDKYFGEGAPGNALVIPTDIDINIYLPNRFFKMTKYRVRLNVESVEDYLENKYFVKTELAHRAHMDLVEAIEAMLK